jgi:peptide/nickel transport system ATP-binding protein
VTADATPRLAVRELTVVTARGGVEILSNVSITANAGEVLGLVGESGCGKTTLGLAMIGYVRRGLRFGGGRVELDGRNLLDLPEKQLLRLSGDAMAYVPQDPATALNPARRVGPQLREALTFHDRDSAAADARVHELLTEVGLDDVPDVLTSYPHQLSGGQQQRVAIAMAFACRPSLIVLDEPTTGLDVTTQRTVLETVGTLCRQYGVAAVYVSHDVAVVAQLAERVAVMYAGRIVEVGAAGDVFGAPAHPYTQGLLQAVPSPDHAAVLIGMPGLPPRPEDRPAGCAYADRCALVQDRCGQEPPVLEGVGADDHLARCWFATATPRKPATISAHDRVAADATADPSLILDVRGLNASYQSTHVLHDVDLQVPRGSCVAVVGESGSGKTTLARCIVGLHTQWDGAITFDGRALAPGVKHRERPELQGVQYVFQNPYASLNPRRSVGGLIAQPVDHFLPLHRAERDAAVLQAIESVTLPVSMAPRYPDQLSGGERQRVAIARTIAVSPSLLVCDEVTSALDVSVQASVVELLRRLQRDEGLSLLFITHNLALVRSIAQYVVVMQAGRVVERGPVDDVLDRPQAAYTQRLLEDVPRPVVLGR